LEAANNGSSVGHGINNNLLGLFALNGLGCWPSAYGCL
jgi:hypothetical protein